MADVFLSYSRKDLTIAQALVEEIERRAWRSVWWDSTRADDGIAPGGEIEATIRRELQRAQFVVVLFSVRSLESSWVRSELNRALAGKANVIPVMLPGIAVDDLPMRLEDRLCIDLRDWAPPVPSRELERLIAHLSKGSPTPFERLVKQAYALFPFTLPFVVLAFVANLFGVFDLLGVDTHLSFVTLSARGLVSPPVIHPDLLLVIIDADTDRSYGRASEFDRWRANHARALRKLAGARVVAYDMFFEEKPEASKGTQELADAIREVRAHGTSVVVGARNRDGAELRVAPPLRAALREPHGHAAGTVAHACLGATNGLSTYVPLVAKDEHGAVFQSLALAAYAGSGKVGPNVDRDAELTLLQKDQATQIRMAGDDLPVRDTTCGALRGTTPARYYLDNFPYRLEKANPAVIPFEHLLEAGVPRERVAGKLVLIGSWREGVDSQRVWDVDGPRDTAGMKVQAAAINTLLREQFIRPVGPGLQLGWLGALAVAASLIRSKISGDRPGTRLALLFSLIGLDLALATALSAAGLLSEVPYHVAVIWLSYSYLTSSAWRLRQLRNRLALRASKARPTEVGV